MDPFIAIMKIVIVCAVLIFVLERFGDMIATVFEVIFYAIIAIVAIGCVGYFLYVKVCYPAYLICCRFISEHLDILVVIISVVVASVLLIILLRIWSNRRRLLTTDYTRLIHHCDQDIASATEALARAEVAEKNYQYNNEFMVLEVASQRFGYNPNSFQQEVNRCRDTLERLKDDKRYYEEQKRKADKLRHR